MSCYKIIPNTKEYRPLSRKEPCKLLLEMKCEHWVHKAGVPHFYPAFYWGGIKEPFIILLAYCQKCADESTIETVLTPERWKRMKMILLDNDQEIPAKKDITMKMELAEYVPSTPGYLLHANAYAYSLAA